MWKMGFLTDFVILTQKTLFMLGTSNSNIENRANFRELYGTSISGKTGRKVWSDFGNSVTEISSWSSCLEQ